MRGDLIPECTVTYDDRAGCGLNVRRWASGEFVFIELMFVTGGGRRESHDITPQQAVELRAALDVATRA